MDLRPTAKDVFSETYATRAQQAEYLSELTAAVSQPDWYTYPQYAAAALRELRGRADFNGAIVSRVLDNAYSFAGRENTYDDRTNILGLYYLTVPEESAFSTLRQGFRELRDRTCSAVLARADIAPGALVRRGLLYLAHAGLKEGEKTSLSPWHNHVAELFDYAACVLPGDVLSLDHKGICEVVDDARALLGEDLSTRAVRQAADVIKVTCRTVRKGINFGTVAIR